MPILELISGKSEGIPLRPIRLASVASDVVSWMEEMWVSRKKLVFGGHKEEYVL